MLLEIIVYPNEKIIAGNPVSTLQHYRPRKLVLRVPVRGKRECADVHVCDEWVGRRLTNVIVQDELQAPIFGEEEEDGCLEGKVPVDGGQIRECDETVGEKRV